MGEPRIYKIVRHYAPRQKRERHTIKAHVTLSEAKAHCSREDTHKDGVYFDAYAYMPGCAPKS